MIVITLLLLLLLIIVIGADVFITYQAQRKSYDDVNNMPACDIGLVLGTAKYLGNLGKQRAINRYYQYRIDAAIALWRAGKVQRFVVSGSGLDETISETECMQADLVAAGVPESAIWQDPAGLRTLDSIVRCAQAFPHQSVCIISQPFHNQRALAQAASCHMHAVAYNTRIVGIKSGWKVHARERAARLRLWYDLAFGSKSIHCLSHISIKQKPTQHGL